MAASDSSIYEKWMSFSKYQIKHRITFPRENVLKIEEVRKACAVLLNLLGFSYYMRLQGCLQYVKKVHNSGFTLVER